MIDRSFSLDELPTGQTALVHRISGPADEVRRLEEFGIHSGIRVEMFRRGNPCILRLAGNKICLRASQPLRVMVEQ